jgi:chromosome partitioning protein
MSGLASGHAGKCLDVPTRGKGMIVTIASHKGGVGKTTTAFHLAAFFQSLAPTLLLDGDETRNATAWSKRGEGVSFKVADEVQAAKLARDFAHIVIDTGQRPKQIDLRALAEGCDLLIVPTVPATLDTEGLVLTIEALTAIGASSYKVLLTKVPPLPETEGLLLRSELEGARGQGRGDLDPNTGSAPSAVSAALWKALGPGMVASHHPNAKIRQTGCSPAS